MNMASTYIIFFLLLINLYAADGFLNYVSSNCLFNSTEPKDIEFISSDYFNKVELFRFSSSVGYFVGYTEYGMKQAAFRNNDSSLLDRMRHEKERFCQNNIEIYYRTILDKSAQPYVRLQAVTPPAGRHPNMLVCSVFDFYPRQISVSWLRDGHKITSDVTSTDELADGDWYYQIHSHLEYTPRSGETISCVVEHASLRRPLITDWAATPEPNPPDDWRSVSDITVVNSTLEDPSMPESERNKIAIGASGLILGLTLSLAGIIYYKKKAGGRILVPTETSWT